jgi:hypothetical protein
MAAHHQPPAFADVQPAPTGLTVWLYCTVEQLLQALQRRRMKGSVVCVLVADWS